MYANRWVDYYCQTLQLRFARPLALLFKMLIGAFSDCSFHFVSRPRDLGAIATGSGCSSLCSRIYFGSSPNQRPAGADPCAGSGLYRRRKMRLVKPRAAI